MEIQVVSIMEKEMHVSFQQIEGLLIAISLHFVIMRVSFYDYWSNKCVLRFLVGIYCGKKLQAFV